MFSCSPTLEKMEPYEHLGKVFDDKGNLVCLFKHCKDGEEDAK